MDERAAHSAERSRTCCSVGTSPVSRSQNMPSGSGSSPPVALGSCSWQSGIVLPRNRMPSSESRTDPSQTRHLIPRAPPYAWSRVISWMTSLPWSFLNFLICSIFSGSCAAKVSLRDYRERRSVPLDRTESVGCRGSERSYRFLAG